MNAFIFAFLFFMLIFSLYLIIRKTFKIFLKDFSYNKAKTKKERKSANEKIYNIFYYVILPFFYI